MARLGCVCSNPWANDLEERKVKAFVGDEKRELSLIQAKINARESYGEGYNGDRMCRVALIRISQNFVSGDDGDCWSPDSR